MVQSHEIGYSEEVKPRVTRFDPNRPGTRQLIYVAPIWEQKDGRRYVVGERLTSPLAGEPNDIRYYGVKGFRLATDEDKERLAGGPVVLTIDEATAPKPEPVPVPVPVAKANPAAKVRDVPADADPA